MIVTSRSSGEGPPARCQRSQEGAITACIAHVGRGPGRYPLPVCCANPAAANQADDAVAAQLAGRTFTPSQAAQGFLQFRVGAFGVASREVADLDAQSIWLAHGIRSYGPSATDIPAALGNGPPGNRGKPGTFSRDSQTNGNVPSVPDSRPRFPQIDLTVTNPKHARPMPIG